MTRTPGAPAVALRPMCLAITLSPALLRATAFGATTGCATSSLSSPPPAATRRRRRRAGWGSAASGRVRIAPGGASNARRSPTAWQGRRASSAAQSPEQRLRSSHNQGVPLPTRTAHPSPVQPRSVRACPARVATCALRSLPPRRTRLGRVPTSEPPRVITARARDQSPAAWAMRV